VHRKVCLAEHAEADCHHLDKRLEEDFLTVVPGEEIIHEHSPSYPGGTAVLFGLLSSEAFPGIV